MDEKVEMTQSWLPPVTYRDVIDVDSGKRMSEIFPDGIFCRFALGHLLTAKNATKEEAEREMEVIRIQYPESVVKEL